MAPSKKPRRRTLSINEIREAIAQILHYMTTQAQTLQMFLAFYSLAIKKGLITEEELAEERKSIEERSQSVSPVKTLDDSLN